MLTSTTIVDIEANASRERAFQRADSCVTQARLLRLTPAQNPGYPRASVFTSAAKSQAMRRGGSAGRQEPDFALGTQLHLGGNRGRGPEVANRRCRRSPNGNGIINDRSGAQ